MPRTHYLVEAGYAGDDSTRLVRACTLEPLQDGALGATATAFAQLRAMGHVCGFCDDAYQLDAHVAAGGAYETFRLRP